MYERNAEWGYIETQRWFVADLTSKEIIMSAAERKIKEQIASHILLPEQYRKEDAARRELDLRTRHG